MKTPSQAPARERPQVEGVTDTEGHITGILHIKAYHLPYHEVFHLSPGTTSKLMAFSTGLYTVQQLATGSYADKLFN